MSYVDSLLWEYAKYLCWVFYSRFMSGQLVESVSEKLLTSILNEAVERIGKKVVSGKKLTDTE
ncbi:MAG: hypothetical protein ACP5IZ_04595, partial [Thermoprotei archaeon]